MNTKMMKAGALLAAGLAVSAFSVHAQAQAQAIDRPVIRVGDRWTYRDTMEKRPNIWTQTHDEVVVTRVTSSTIYVKTTEVGSPANVKERLATLDWGYVRDVNGVETLVNQPLSFPLTDGKTWQVDFTEKNPLSNKAHSSEKWASKCTASGPTPIEVPAGKFNAMKVECEGTWTAELAPAQRVVQMGESTQSGAAMRSEVSKVAPRTISGRFYREFWYAPEVKRFLKNVEEYYDPDGIRTARYTGELESYKLAQ